MKVISLFLMCILLLGCGTRQAPTVYKTEYFEVLVPVVNPITRPNRPVFTDKDTIHTYLIEVLEYTTILEILIDEQNTKKEDVHVP